MDGAIADLDVLLASMEPRLNPRQAAYVMVRPGETLPFDPAGEAVIGLFREQEGTTLIVDWDAALRAGVPVVFRAAWITLRVHSDLEAVGLTAAFAAALAAEGIGCNVVAGAMHDHIFVPAPLAARAMAALRRLQARSASG